MHRVSDEGIQMPEIVPRRTRPGGTDRARAILLVAVTLMTVLLCESGHGRQAGEFQHTVKKPLLVGRISHVEGTLLRFVSELDDWVLSPADTPFALFDALYSDRDSRVELKIPGNIRVRTGGSTQIQAIALNGDLAFVDMASGVARFHNRSVKTLVKASTPFGFVVASPDVSFDLYVGDHALEILVLAGRVEFIHEAGHMKYGIAAGPLSLIADRERVRVGSAEIDRRWDEWDREREGFWAERTRSGGLSAKCLPADFSEDACILEEYGRWEKVYYEGDYRLFWRPAADAGSGWAPFTAGRWTVYYGDHCWVPCEPFGYVTHHYGNWVQVGPAWFWAPPADASGEETRGSVSAVGPEWYPGRVAWIASSNRAGWVPLAPLEPYYTHVPWGPRSIPIGDAPLINIDSRRYRFINGAVTVDSGSFYGAKNYAAAGFRSASRNSRSAGFHVAPFVNEMVIPGFSSRKEKYEFSSTYAGRRPHRKTVDKILFNYGTAVQASDLSAVSIMQQIDSAEPGPVLPALKALPVELTDRMVSPAEVDLPEERVRFMKAPLKTGSGGMVRRPGGPGPQRETTPATRSRNNAKPEVVR